MYVTKYPPPPSIWTVDSLATVAKGRYSVTTVAMTVFKQYPIVLGPFFIRNKKFAPPLLATRTDKQIIGKTENARIKPKFGMDKGFDPKNPKI